MCAHFGMITTIKLLYLVPHLVTMHVYAGVCALMWCVLHMCIIVNSDLTYCVCYICVTSYLSPSDPACMNVCSDSTCEWLHAS